jgi:ribosomal protein S17
MKLQGKVVSIKKLSEKTITVEVTRERYIEGLKVLKYKKKFQAHSDLKVNLGDSVVIEPCRRISKTKYYKVGALC